WDSRRSSRSRRGWRPRRWLHFLSKVLFPRSMTSFSEFFHSDDGVRADLRAAGACNALADVRHMGGVIPLPVDDGLIDGDDVLRAHSGAQLTALAPVRVEGYLCCHGCRMPPF
ncbi:DUF281 domain-containing protein, partial [Dysosmobacter welbionis]